MKTNITILLLTLATLVVAGCSSPAARIKRNPELFASIPPAQQEIIKQGRIDIGFTPNMVKLALGEPDSIAKRTDNAGTSEIWRYSSVDASADYNLAVFQGWGGGWWGGNWWGSPLRYRGWHGWPSYYGWGYSGYGWGVALPPPVSDHLRVTIRNGRVVEINQLR